MTFNFPNVKANSFAITLKYPNIYEKSFTLKPVIISKYPNAHVTMTSTFSNVYTNPFTIVYNYPNVHAESFAMASTLSNIYTKSFTIVFKFPNVHVKPFSIIHKLPNVYAESFTMVDVKPFTIVSKLPINIFGKCDNESYAFTCSVNSYYLIINPRPFDSTKEKISKYLYSNVNVNLNVKESQIQIPSCSTSSYEEITLQFHSKEEQQVLHLLKNMYIGSKQRNIHTVFNNTDYKSNLLLLLIDLIELKGIKIAFEVVEDFPPSLLHLINLTEEDANLFLND